MMLLLLTGALVVGLAVSQSNSGFSYQVGKEYTYEYEGQVLTGIPHGSKIFSGFKVKCKALWQFKLSITTVTIKLTNIQVYKINDQVDEEYDPTSQMLPDSLFEEATEPDVDTFVTELSRPVEFTYIRGHVSDIKTEKDDPYWSVNFKKGFLSLFEMNFNERQSFEAQASIRSSSVGMDKKFYRVMEQSVAGECETTYMLDPTTSTSEYESLFLTKVRNYNKCLSRPYYLHSIFSYDDCYECLEKKFDPMSSQSQIRYSVQGTSRQFMILSAVGESVHSFTAYNELGGSFVTFINQTLVYSDYKNIEEQISNPQSPKMEDSGLVADMPEKKKQSWNPSSIVPDDADLSEGYPYFDQRFIYEKVKDLLRAYKEFTDEMVKEEAALVYMELKRFLKMASKQTLVDLVTEFGSESFYGNTLYNILPFIGTYPSVDILVNSIIKGDVKPELAEFILPFLGLYAEPHILTMKRVLDLLNRMTSWPTPMMKRTAWLSLGTMSYKMTTYMLDARKELMEQFALVQKILEQETRKNSRDAIQSKQDQIEEKIRQADQIYGKIKNEIVQTVMNLLHSGDKSDRILAMKTIGNAGFREFIPELKKMVEDKTQPFNVRLTAAYAFRRITRYAQNEVKEIFMQRYFDIEDIDEMRMAGVFHIFKTNPTPSELEMIARSLWHETSENVGTFVYSMLEQLSNSTHPCESTLAWNATLALRLAKRFEPSRFFSSFMRSHSYDSLWRIGNTRYITMFFSPGEFSPRAMFYGFSLEMFSKSNPMVEVGYVAKGLDSFVRAWMRPVSSRASQTPANFKSARVLQDSSPRISSIKQKLKVSPREYENYEGNMLIKFFGNEICYYDLEEILPLMSSQVMASQAKSTLNRMLNFERLYNFADHHKAFSTELGFPLRLVLDGVLVAKVAGNIDTETENVENPASQTARSAFNTRWNALVNIKPSGALDLWWKMSCDAAIFMNGVMVKSNIHLDYPLQLKTNIDFPNRKFILKTDIASEKRTLITMESKPLTFFTFVSRKSSRYPQVADTKEITVAEGAFIVPFEKEYGAYVFGHTISLTGQQVLSENQRGVVFFPLSGKQTFTLIHTPGLDPAPSYVFQFQHVMLPLRSKTQAEKQQKSKSGIWSWISPMFESEETERNPTSTRSQSSPNSRFIDIEKEDLTLQKIIDFFGPKARELPDSMKSGVIMRLAENTPDPRRQFQIATLWQRAQGNRQQLFNMEFRRTPCPSYETEDWVKDTQIQMQFPVMEAKPSDLFGPAYQEEIQKKIRMSISSNGKVDHIWDLEGAINTQETMILKKLAQSMTAEHITEAVMKHVIEKSRNPQVQELRMVTYQLRKISTEVRKIQQQAKDPVKAQATVPKVKSIIETFRRIKDALLRQVQGAVTATVQQLDEAPALIHYAILKQQKVTANLKEVARRIQTLAPQDVREEIQSAVQQQEESWKAIRQSYEQTVASRQTLERQRIQPEFSPDRHSLYRSLQDIESKLNDLASKLRQQKEQTARSMSSSSSPSSIETASAQIEQIAQDGKRLKEHIDKAMEKSALEKMLRVKVLEVVLQQEQAVQDIAEIIESYQKSKKPSYSGYNPLRLAAEHSPNPIQKDLSRQKEQVKQQSKWLAMRVGVSISHEEEQMSIAWFASTKDNDTLRELQAAEVLQIGAVEKLEPSKDRYQPGQEEEPTTKRVQEAVAVAEEAWSRIKKVVQDKEFESNGKRLEAGKLVMFKAYRILARQSAVAAEVKRTATEKIFSRTAKDSSDAKVAEHVKQTADKIIQEVPELQKTVAAIIEGARLRSSASSVQSPEPFLSESVVTGWREKLWNAELQDESVESQPFSSTEEDAEPRRMSNAWRQSSKGAWGLPDEFYCMLKCVYGPESQMNKEFVMKIVGKKSLEQLMWEEDQWSPLKQDPLVRQYLSEKQEGQEQASPSYQNIRKELNTLRHIHTVVTYEKENIAEMFRDVTWKLHEYMKANWYHHAYFVLPDSTNKENVVEIISEFRRNNRQLDTEIKTPYETNIFHGLNLSPAVTHWLMSVYPSSVQEVVAIALTNAPSRPARCTISTESVHTFDGAFISMLKEQPSSCETVLAMDCSQHSSFVVSSKPNPQDPQWRKITIRTRQMEVETSTQSGKVMVNGEEIYLQDGETRKTGSADDEVSLERSEDNIVISVPALDLVVVTDGQQTIVEVSSWLKSQMCGMCGNNDGQKSNEGQDPQQRHCSQAAALSASYLIPDDTCNALQIQAQARVEEFCRSSDECSPLYQNKVVEQEVHGEQKLCFSIEPVRKCPSSCKAKGSISYHKGIHCLDARSPQAQKLLQDSKFRPLDELRHKTVSQYIYNEEPTSCVRETIH